MLSQAQHDGRLCACGNWNDEIASSLALLAMTAFKRYILKQVQDDEILRARTHNREIASSLALLAMTAFKR